MSKGFTLIEVIVASLIMMLFSSFLFLVINSSLSGIRSSDEYLTAILKVSSTIETIKQMPFNDLLSYDGGLFDDNKGSVSVKQKGQDIFEIVLIYKWKEGRHPIELWTMKSRF